MTTVAAAMLVLAVPPHQQRMLTHSSTTGTDDARPAVAARLAGRTGVFNLLWATVAVLMIVRPGSTTGA